MSIENENSILGEDPNLPYAPKEERLHGLWVNQLLVKNHWRKVARAGKSTLKRELGMPSKTTVTRNFIERCKSSRVYHSLLS